MIPELFTNFSHQIRKIKGQTLCDKVGIKRQVPLCLSSVRQIYLPLRRYQDFLNHVVSRFREDRRGFRSTCSSPLIHCWHCRPELYFVRVCVSLCVLLHIYSGTSIFLPAQVPVSITPGHMTLSEWGFVGQKLFTCLVQKEEALQSVCLTKASHLFLPLALACHANEQQHMWLCD